MYRLICSSHKPDAEMFEKWVFDELLPTIRATGGYVNDPVVFVNEWLPNTDEKTKELLVTSLEAVKRQDKIIGVQNHAVTAATNCIEIGEFAKYLSNNKISIGRNRLFAWLREQKYLDSNNMPYQNPNAQPQQPANPQPTYQAPVQETAPQQPQQPTDTQAQ